MWDDTKKLCLCCRHFAHFLQGTLAGADEEASIDDTKSRSMCLTAGTIVAYWLYELRINVIDGSFEPVLNTDNKGGYTEDQLDSATLSGKFQHRILLI